MEKPEITVKTEAHLFHKHLSKFSCLMIGIGGLIGGGIFSVIGAISTYTGPYAYMSYLITGCIGLFNVYSYTKLTKKWSDPGGEYSCVSQVFCDTSLAFLGPFIGILLYFGYISTMALYAYTFSIYFLLIFNIKYDFIVISIIIAFIISMFALVNLKGAKESSRIQNIIVSLQILILILFVIFGLNYSLKTPNTLLTNVGFNTGLFSKFPDIFIGSGSIIVSYVGFQLIAYHSYEMKDVNGGLKTMKWSLIISMLIYIAVAFTAVAVLGVSGLVGGSSSDAEIAIANAASNFMGPLGMFVMIIGALLSTSSSLNATMLGSSRLAYMVSFNKVFPRFFSKISKNKVPYNSIIITGVFSVVLSLITGGALAIAGIAGLIFAQVFFIINYTAFKSRKVIQSKPIINLLGMVFMALLFITLMTNYLTHLDSEFYSLIAFACIELVTLFFVLNLRKKKKK
ncbi:MAG: APC family permease [Candidatus Lokiarchaeota archaeon]|nr:APC family permease [Candidatus Lokiarchaeota archaeon]